MDTKLARHLWDYCPFTGVFRWRTYAGPKAPTGSIAGRTTPDGRYRQIGYGGKLYYAHRLAWLWMWGRWPDHEIDHRDTDGLNNRFSNLRASTDTQNQGNKRKLKPGTSGVKGVSWHKATERWRACITIKGKPQALGSFHSIDDAAQAYRLAAKQYFGEFYREG